MEFDDVSGVVYETLKYDYNMCSTHVLGWSDYLTRLDIGIQDTETGLKYVGSGKYKITDQKKWLFARLKYGL